MIILEVNFKDQMKPKTKMKVPLRFQILFLTYQVDINVLIKQNIDSEEN